MREITGSQCKRSRRDATGVDGDLGEQYVAACFGLSEGVFDNGCGSSEQNKGKASPYSITDSRVPELIPVLGSHPACDLSHKPSGRLPLLSARPAVTPTTLKRAAANFAAW